MISYITIDIVLHQLLSNKHDPIRIIENVGELAQLFDHAILWNNTQLLHGTWNIDRYMKTIKHLSQMYTSTFQSPKGAN